jgi:hypothetical protein
MSTMRSAEPSTGLNATLARLFPFLNEPREGERGTDRHGIIHVYSRGQWVIELDRESEAGA